jgi:hypothetical protein
MDAILTFLNEHRDIVDNFVDLVNKVSNFLIAIKNKKGRSKERVLFKKIARFLETTSYDFSCFVNYFEFTFNNVNYPITNNTFTIDDLIYLKSLFTDLKSVFKNILDLMNNNEIFKQDKGFCFYMEIKNYHDEKFIKIIDFIDRRIGLYQT